jgi:ATP-dependent protease ClpP protease subunit
MVPAKAEDGAAEIRLYDVISREWGQSAEQFAKDLKDLRGSSVHLRVNSPGGDVQEGWAIYNTIKADPRDFHGHVDGAAYSMASVILTACDTVEQPSNAMQLVHKPWSVAIGNADAFRKQADWLDKMETHLLDAYQNRCGGKTSREDLKKMVDAETLIDGREALAMGLIDTCTDPMKAAACKIDLAGMKTDDRVKALFADAKPVEASNDAPPAPAPVVAPVTPAAPILLDAAVVESRIESERALARAEGRAEGIASRDAEVSGLTAEAKTLRDQLATAKAEIDNSRANVAQLKATVDTEKKMREAAEKAHAALLGGAKYHPVDADEGADFEQLLKKYGYEEARQRFPAAYATFMKQKAPGTKAR